MEGTCKTCVCLKTLIILFLTNEQKLIKKFLLIKWNKKTSIETKCGTFFEDFCIKGPNMQFIFLYGSNKQV